MYRRVIYLCSTHDHMADADVQKLYDVASENAARDDLTGLTAYHRKSMIHIREGDAQLVSNSIVRAESQGWHYNLSIVQDDMFEERLFDDWNLSFVPGSADALIGRPRLFDLTTLGEQPTMARAKQDPMFSTFFEVFAADIEDVSLHSAFDGPSFTPQVQSQPEFLDAIAAGAGRQA